MSESRRPGRGDLRPAVLDLLAGVELDAARADRALIDAITATGSGARFPEVRRLAHPDGGADTLPPVADDRASEVWRAKRFPDNINWKECQDSLDSSI